MPRTRKVTSTEILDAAERVAVNLGASRLSIDAVAQEAGISKTRVVYDYKSKTALLEAMIDRQFQKDTDRLKVLLHDCADTPNPELFARIKLAEKIPDDREKAIAIAVSSSMLSETTLREKVQDWIAEDMKAIMKGARPEAARMTHFALMGFCCHEWFGLASWSEKERRTTLEGIRKIYTSFPESQKS